MEVPQFPQTDNQGLWLMFNNHVSPLMRKITEQKKKVDSLRPPSKEDINTFLAGSDDARIVELLEELRQLTSRIDQIDEELDKLAKEELNSSANADEKAAARQLFNATKNNLTNSLYVLANVASHEGEQDIVNWVNTALEKVPRLANANKASDQKEMRTWLQEHHPEANIKSRGSIPKEWQTVYFNRDK